MSNNLKCHKCFRDESLTQIKGRIICGKCIYGEKVEDSYEKFLEERFKTRWTKIWDWIVKHRNDIFSIANLIILVASLIVSIIALKK